MLGVDSLEEKNFVVKTFSSIVKGGEETVGNLYCDLELAALGESYFIFSFSSNNSYL